MKKLPPASIASIIVVAAVAVAAVLYVNAIKDPSSVMTAGVRATWVTMTTEKITTTAKQAATAPSEAPTVPETIAATTTQSPPATQITAQTTTTRAATTTRKPTTKAPSGYDNGNIKELAKPTLTKNNAVSGVHDITGTLKNNSGKEYTFVELAFSLYDKNGKFLGMHYTSTHHWEAGRSWTYKTYTVKDYYPTVASVKLYELRVKSAKNYYPERKERVLDKSEYKIVRGPELVTKPSGRYVECTLTNTSGKDFRGVTVYLNYYDNAGNFLGHRSDYHSDWAAGADMNFQWLGNEHFKFMSVVIKE